MVVSAGEAEAAATVGPFGRPGNVLRNAVRHFFAHVGITGAHAVRKFQADRRNRAQDRGDGFHAVLEAHVEIPFVVRGEGADAVGDRMDG